MKILLTLTLAITYIIIMIFLLSKKDKKIELTLSNATVIVTMIIFGLVFPANYLLSLAGLSADIYIQNYELMEASDIAILYIFATLASLFFILVLKHSRSIKMFSRFDNGNNRDSSRLLLTAIALLIIGLVSNQLYLSAYGGFSNYLNFNRLLRFGINVVDNNFSFLMPLRSCVVFSSFLFALLLKKRKKKIIAASLFVVSLIFSIMVLYSNLGRLSILLYVLLLLLALFYKGKTKYVTYRSFIRIAVCSFLLVIALFFIGGILNRNDEGSLLAEFNSEITFPFQNLFVIRNKLSTFDYRYFSDIAFFPVYLLPSSIWSVKMGIKTCSSIVTAAWWGAEKGSNGVYGEMPVDFVTLSYLQLGVVGAIIVPIILAFIYHKCFLLAGKIRDDALRMFIYLFLFINVGVYSVFYCDPYLIIQRNLPLMAFAVLYAFLGIFYKKGVGNDT